MSDDNKEPAEATKPDSTEPEPVMLQPASQNLTTAPDSNTDNNPLNKSYDSMDSKEVEEPHYNFDSDGEPP